jgi:hypothetical protein
MEKTKRKIFLHIYPFRAFRRRREGERGKKTTQSRGRRAAGLTWERWEAQSTDDTYPTEVKPLTCNKRSEVRKTRSRKNCSVGSVELNWSAGVAVNPKIPRKRKGSVRSRGLYLAGANGWRRGEEDDGGAEACEQAECLALKCSDGGWPVSLLHI